MAIKTIRVFAEYTSDGYVPMPSQGNIDYGITIGNSFPETQPSSYQTDDPNIDVAVNTMIDFYVWIRTHGSPWNPSYTRVVRVYPDSPSINSVVMNMIVAVGSGGTSINAGGGVTYYLNGGTSQGILDGSTYYEMSKTPVEGAMVDFFKINTTGFENIAQFVTDAGDPSLLKIPPGAWPLGFYFSASDNSGTPKFYAEIYKYSQAGVFTLLGSSVASAEVISNGVAIDYYTTTVTIPDTTLLITDRIAIRIFVDTDGNRTVNFHTQDSHLASVGTTFANGLTAINGLTKQVQFIAIGNAGSDAAIVSSDDTHTINLPTASATKRGLLNSTDWSTFNAKQAALSGTGFVKIDGSTISYDNSSYQPLDGDLTAIGALAGTTGILKKTAANTWELDTTTYLSTGVAASTYQRLDKMVSNLLASDTEYPNSNAVLAALALKANALNPEFTGSMTVGGAYPKIYLTDSDNNPDYFIGNDDGYFRIYDQTNTASRFYITNLGVSTFPGSVIVGSIAKSGGLSTEFLKADGTVDANTYVTSGSLSNYLLSATAASTYQRLDKMVSNLLASDTEYPNSNAVLAALALKADSASPTFTGNMTISGASPKLYLTDTDNNPDYFVGNDDGYFRIYDQTAGASRFYITSLGVSTFPGDVIVGSIAKSGGTASQFLKADGSVDSSTYALSSALSSYLLSADAVTTYQRKDKMVSNLLASDTEYPNSNAVIAALALKANAANPTFTGDFTISGATPRLYFVDTDNNPDYTLFTDSGYFYIYNQTAGATKFSINTDGHATFTNNVNVNGVFNFSASGNISFTSDDANDYPRFTGNYASAQIGLFRSGSDIGGMYIGGTATGFRIFNETFATRFYLDQSGNGTFWGSATATSFIKSGGTSSQYLMADGSVSTLSNPVTGTGTTNYLPKWTSASGLGNSIVFDTGTNVGINTASPATILHVNGGAVMTGGWNKTATLQAQFPTLIFNSNASRWGAIGYDYSNAMSFWVNGTSDNVNGTGLNAFQIYNSGSADFNFSLTVANALNVGKVGDVIYTKSNGSSYSRFLYSGGYVNVVFTGGTDANNGAFGINNYEDTVRLFNMTNGGTAIFAGNVLVNGATTLTGIQGGVAVNGTTSSGVVYRLSNTNRGYTYMSQNGNMNVETTSGSISLAPNGSSALTIATTGAATFSNNLTVNGIYYVPSTSYFIGNSASGYRFNNSSDTLNLLVIRDNGNTIIGGSTDAGFKLDVIGTGRFKIDGLSKFGLDILNNNGARGAGFYNTGGNNVQLYFYNSSGAEKIVLDGGVGQAEFGGNIYIGRSNTYGYIYGPSNQIFGSVGGNTTWINSGTSGLRFNNAADNATRMFMSDAGNFGIGTTSTSGKLHVKGDIVIERSSIAESSTITMEGGEFDIKSSPVGYNMRFFTGTSGTAIERMRILASGPVNLGVTSDYLQFFNDGGGLYAEGTASTDAKRKIRIQMGNSSYSQYSSVFIDGANQAVGITTGNTTKLYVTQTGFVGIGTSSPSAPIHVIGGTTMSGGWARTAMIRATYPVMVFNSNDSRWAGLGYDYSGSGAFILWVNATSENVSGTGVQAFNIANNRDASFYGSITATSFFESSDSRLKNLLEDDVQVKDIENLKAKLYTKNGKKEYGYFAQEAETYMPSAVTRNDKGYLNLSYREVHTVKIARLEREVEQLKKQLNVA